MASVTTGTIAKTEKSDKADGASSDNPSPSPDAAAQPETAVAALVVTGLASVPVAAAPADDDGAATPPLAVTAAADGGKPVAESARGASGPPAVTARPDVTGAPDAEAKSQPSASTPMVSDIATTEQAAPPALAGALKAVVGTGETAATVSTVAGLTDRKSVGEDSGSERTAGSDAADAQADSDDGKSSSASASPSKTAGDAAPARAVAVAATNTATPRADDRKTNDATLVIRNEDATGPSIIVTPLMTHTAGGALNAQPAAAVAAGAAAAIPIAGLAAEITARALEGKRRFEIRLDPPELGRIDVRLDVGKDGQVTSRLVVERSETLDLLRRDAPNLERALESAGLRTNDSGLQFSLRDQSPNGYRPRFDDMPRPNLLIVPDDDVAVREAVRRGYGALRGFGTGIDIRV